MRAALLVESPGTPPVLQDFVTETVNERSHYGVERPWGRRVTLTADFAGLSPDSNDSSLRIPVIFLRRSQTADSVFPCAGTIGGSDSQSRSTAASAIPPGSLTDRPEFACGDQHRLTVLADDLAFESSFLSGGLPG